MIGFLLYLTFIFPITIFLYCIAAFFYFIAFLIQFIGWSITVIGYIIGFIFYLLKYLILLITNKQSSKTYKTEYQNQIFPEPPKFNSNVKSIFKEKELSWKEKEFEKEAKLWGLSESDKRIAKEERMSPADFIEAEERDDDELVTDEWE